MSSLEPIGLLRQLHSHKEDIGLLHVASVSPCGCLASSWHGGRVQSGFLCGGWFTGGGSKMGKKAEHPLRPRLRNEHLFASYVHKLLFKMSHRGVSPHST